MNLPRTCLSFTNLSFFCVAFLCFLACVWCIFNAQMFREVNYSLTKSHYVPALADMVSLRLWSAPLTTVLILAAALTMLTSCCGIVGAGCKVKCAIRSYVFLVTVIACVAFWLFFVTGVYGIYSGNPSTRAYLSSTIRTHYGDDGDLVSFLWDHLMLHYECCGASGFSDFSESKWREKHPGDLFPVHCCTLMNKTTLTPFDPECTKTAIEGAGNHMNSGCFDVLRAEIRRNKRSFIFYATIVSLSYFLLVSFSYCLIRGEPLLNADSWMPIKMQPNPPPVQPQPPRLLQRQMTLPPAKEVKVTMPGRTFPENAVFAEEPPRKVVRVVSAINPGLSYKWAPSDAYSNVYRGNETWPYHLNNQIKQ